MVEKAQAVANLQKLEDFYALYWDFGQESYEEGFNKGELRCQVTILDHFP